LKRNYRLEMIHGEDVDKIIQGAIQLLGKVGVEYQDRKALEALETTGAQVDYKTNIARFTPEQVKDALMKVAPKFDWYYKNFDQKLEIGGDNVYFGISTYDHYILDYENMQRRLATLADIGKFLVLDDTLENIDIQGPEVVPHDVPVPLMQIKAAEMLFTYVRKGLLFSMLNRNDAKYILKMAEVIAGGKKNLRKRPFMIVPICPASPFKYQKDVVDLIFAATEHGLPVMVGPCPICGISSPVTLAGTITQALAEQLAGILLAKAIDKQVPVCAGSTPFMVNFREGNLLAGAPERVLVEAVLAQIHQHLHVPCTGSGTMSDAKIPTIQMGYEKGMGLLLLSLAGSNHVNACPVLDEGNTTAFEQHLIEADAVGMATRMLNGVTVSDETLALDVIQKAGRQADFLKSPHSLKHAKTEHWLPNVMFRGSWRIFEQQRTTVVKTATEKTREIWNKRQLAALPEDIAGEIRAIVKEAEKELS